MKKIITFLLLLALLVPFAVPAQAATTLQVAIVSDIDAPVPGFTPDYSATLGSSDYRFIPGRDTLLMKSGITWYDGTVGKYISTTDTFIEGHEYWVEIHLAPAVGKTFSDDAIGFVNGENIGVVAGGGSEIALVYSFPVCEKMVLDVAEVSQFDAPAAGNTPNYSGMIHGNNYFFAQKDEANFYNGVTWYDATDGCYIPVDHKFIEGHDYMIEVHLIPEKGYTFSLDTVGYVNGEYIGVVAGGGDEITLVYQFPTCPKADKVQIEYARMSLGNSLEFQFAVPVDGRENWDGCRARILKYWENGSTTQTTIPLSLCSTVTIGGRMYWVVIYEGVAAKEMTDMFEVTIYDQNWQTVSVTHRDSVRSYVDRAYDDQKAAGKTMLVDMLNYGAAAQLYFGYNVTNLANKDLSVSQQVAGTSGTPTLSSWYNPGDNYTGTRLVLESRIQMQVAFSGLTRDMYAVYSYMDNKGVMRNIEVSGAEFITVGNMLAIELDELVYADARTDVDVQVYNADGSLYGWVTDSIEAYSCRSSNNLQNELIKFADSAKIYLCG